MKRFLVLLLLLVFPVTAFGQTKMYGRTALIGGTASVDNIAYATISDGDLCMVVNSSKEFYIYRFNASSTVSGTSSPDLIEPIDQAGNGDWELVTFIDQDLDTGASVIFDIVTATDEVVTVDAYPVFSFKDTDAPVPGTKIGDFYFNYTDGISGDENVDFYFRSMSEHLSPGLQNIMLFDASIPSVEFTVPLVAKDSLWVDFQGTTDPTVPAMTFRDEDTPGTGKEGVRIFAPYVDGGDGSENFDIYINALQDGSWAEILRWDEDDDRWEFGEEDVDEKDVYAKSFIADPSAEPGIAAHDSGAPDTTTPDQIVGRGYWNYIGGGDDLENSDFYLTIWQDGLETTFLQIDESDDRIEIADGVGIDVDTLYNDTSITLDLVGENIVISDETNRVHIGDSTTGVLRVGSGYDFYVQDATPSFLFYDTGAAGTDFDDEQAGRILVNITDDTEDYEYSDMTFSTMDYGTMTTFMMYDISEERVEASVPLTSPKDIITTTDGAESPAAADMYGTWFIADHATAANDTDYTLPSAVEGMNACFYDNGGGDGGIIIDAATGDEILLYGSGVGVADAIDSPGVAGAGANGDYICIIAIDSTYWITEDYSGTWVDGDAD